MLAEEQSNPTQTPPRCGVCLCMIYIYSVEDCLCIPDLWETFHVRCSWCLAWQSLKSRRSERATGVRVAAQW